MEAAAAAGRGADPGVLSIRDVPKNIVDVSLPKPPDLSGACLNDRLGRHIEPMRVIDVRCTSACSRRCRQDGHGLGRAKKLLGMHGDDIEIV